jgi:hypothetical protein
MNVNRHVERFGRREDVPELLVVEVFAVGVRVHDGALQAEGAHAALELGGGCGWILRRDSCEARVARRVRRDRGRELVVDGACQRDARRRVEDLHSGGRQRQDLEVDARRVHVADAPRAQILQPLADGAGALARVLEVVTHQAVEADVVRALAGEQLAIGADEVLRCERFFRRDALETQVGTQVDLR